ncbi:MAG TPA: hypothetical protein VJN96_27135 [Vicinamibacterales bacterium]|nr:hypothetical protein [Vicinamibacterales bacterium]
MNEDFKTRLTAGIVSALIPIGADFMKILPEELRPIPRFEPAITFATMLCAGFACATALFMLPKPLPKADRGKWARWAILWLAFAAVGFTAYYELGMNLSSTANETPILIIGAWAVSVACVTAAFTIVGSSLPKGA